jgi:hypothetical protein
MELCIIGGACIYAIKMIIAGNDFLDEVRGVMHGPHYAGSPECSYSLIDLRNGPPANVRILLVDANCTT